MRTSLCRIVLAAACLIWLAGCEATSTDNPFVKLVTPAKPTSGASEGDPTGSVLALERVGGAPPLTPELLGADPNDDLSTAKKYFRQGS
jgi:hypothetical protein